MPTKIGNRMHLSLLLVLSFATSCQPVQASPTPTTEIAAFWSSVPYASDDPNVRLWEPDTPIEPEAERESLGADILGPQNIPLELESADLLAPPTTDHGDV